MWLLPKGPGLDEGARGTPSRGHEGTRIRPHWPFTSSPRLRFLRTDIRGRPTGPGNNAGSRTEVTGDAGTPVAAASAHGRLSALLHAPANLGQGPAGPSADGRVPAVTEVQGATKAQGSGEQRYLGGLPGCGDLGGWPGGGKQQQPEQTGLGQRTGGSWGTCADA